MARPRTISDADILTAAVRVIGRGGPGRLTLADVAAEANLSAPTLVQRFGSKRGLLLAVAASGRDGAARVFAAARAAHRSPLAALETAVIAMPAAIASPEELANHAAFLQLDLSDPDFHRLALDQARTVRAELQRLLAAAVEEGELTGINTSELAAALQVTYNGVLITWAIDREGALDARLRQALDVVLRPYRRPGGAG